MVALSQLIGLRSAAVEQTDPSAAERLREGEQMLLKEQHSGAGVMSLVGGTSKWAKAVSKIAPAQGLVKQLKAEIVQTSTLDALRPAVPFNISQLAAYIEGLRKLEGHRPRPRPPVPAATDAGRIHAR